MYIISTNYDDSIHAGYCIDIKKVISFYDSLRTINLNLDKFNNLVYLEELTNKHAAFERFKEITALNRTQKEALIETVNPEWVELKPGINIEL